MEEFCNSTRVYGDEGFYALSCASLSLDSHTDVERVSVQTPSGDLRCARNALSAELRTRLRLRLEINRYQLGNGVVRAEMFRYTPLHHDVSQALNDVGGAPGAPHPDGQTLPGVLIHHREETNMPAVPGANGHEVVCPHVVLPFWSQRPPVQQEKLRYLSAFSCRHHEKIPVGRYSFAK